MVCAFRMVEVEKEMKIYYVALCDGCFDCISHIGESWCGHEDAPDNSNLKQWDKIPNWCPLPDGFVLEEAIRCLKQIRRIGADESDSVEAALRMELLAAEFLDGEVSNRKPNDPNDI